MTSKTYDYPRPADVGANLRSDLLLALDGGLFQGSNAAVSRLRRGERADYLGTNLLGDHVYDLNQILGEKTGKYLYVSPFSKPTARGASARITVAPTPAR